MEVQDEINKTLLDQNKTIVKDMEVQKTTTDYLMESNESFKMDINILKDNERSFVNFKQLSEVSDLINVKVDRFELNKLYEMKSNKNDINTLVKVMGHLHD